MHSRESAPRGRELNPTCFTKLLDQLHNTSCKAVLSSLAHELAKSVTHKEVLQAMRSLEDHPVGDLQVAMLAALAMLPEEHRKVCDLLVGMPARVAVQSVDVDSKITVEVAKLAQVA